MAQNIPPILKRDLRTVSMSYDALEPLPSILKIIQTLLPDWGQDDAKVDVEQMTGGVNNTLYKAQNVVQGLSKTKIERNAVLIRVYGDSSDILIDRERELSCHCLLHQYDLAPRIVGRFDNGYVYGFVPGTVCSPSEISRGPVWRAVARKMAEWHAILPSGSPGDKNLKVNISEDSTGMGPSPDLWSVLQKWIMALPVGTEEEETRQVTLTAEAKRLIADLGSTSVLGLPNFVIAHCDLLSGNIILRPKLDEDTALEDVEQVDFIDYEYTMPTPAAFDVACHFAEWVGFECDYNLLPTQAQRRAFLAEYILAHNQHAPSNGKELLQDLDNLCKEVDAFRGLPGLFWGIAALLQATTMKLDFDFKAYADLRMKEYWDWRAEEDGSRAKEGGEMPLRESRWARKE